MITTLREAEFSDLRGRRGLKTAVIRDEAKTIPVLMKSQRESGRKCVQMLVAYGVCLDDRPSCSFIRGQGESHGACEGPLNDLYRRGLRGQHLQLIITDGCPGLAGAIQTVYPRVLHQHCWVHKMRNIREKGRQCDRDELKQMAPAISLGGGSQKSARGVPLLQTALATEYPSMVKQLEKDLPNNLRLLSCDALATRAR